MNIYFWDWYIPNRSYYILEVFRLKEQKKQLEQNKHETPMTILSRSLLTGFIGGVIWSAFGTVLYFFNFSQVAPKSFVLSSWFHADWIDTWLGNIIAILVIGIISIAVALVYFLLFKKAKSVWMGVAFGIILWGAIFYVLNPIFTTVPSVQKLDIDTIVSSLCAYILYGTFIGYSISYDYHDLQGANNNANQTEAKQS